MVDHPRVEQQPDEEAHEEGAQQVDEHLVRVRVRVRVKGRGRGRGRGRVEVRVWV